MDKKPEGLTRDHMLDLVMNQAPLDSEDKKNMREFAHSKTMKKMLHYLLKESDAEGAKMLAMPLFTEEQVNRVRTVQGTARGISNAVELLIDLMLPDEEKPEGET